MKSLKRITLLIILTLITTGCMKLEVTMDINKDKSMTFGMIQAIDKSLLEQSDETTILEEEDKKELEQNGFKIEPYQENDMEGYKITKTINNIDTVSTEKDITSSLDITETGEQKYLFTVKKGFLKNTYKAKFESVDENNLSDELDTEINETTDSTFENSYNDYSYDLEDDTTYNDTENNLDDFDYSALMSGMELNMKVNLPYKAISNNATSVTNDGKTLTWDMLKLKDENIEFEFEMYNIQNIIICATAIILLIIIIIVLITKRGKSKKQNQGNQQPVSVEENNINNTTNNTEVTNQNITTQQETIVGSQLQQAPSSSATNNFTPVQNTNVQGSEINSNNNQNLSQSNIFNSTLESNQVQPNNVVEINQSAVETNNLEQPITEIKETKIDTPPILNSIELIKEQPTQTIQNNIVQSTDISSTNLNSQSQQTNTIVEPQTINNVELQPQNNIVSSNNVVESNQATVELNNIVQPMQATQNNIAQSTDIFSTNLNNQPQQINTIVEPQITNNIELQPQNNVIQPTIQSQQNTTQDTINKNSPIFPE